MENMGLGAGLAAIAFWGFIAAVVLGGIWDSIRKRDAQHETVRRLIESGQAIDDDLLEKLQLVGNSGGSRPDRDFYVTGLWLLPISVGLAMLALFLGQISSAAQSAVLGAAALVACLGIGALIGARITSRWYTSEGKSAE
jgi:hypothetical protein